MDRWSAAVRRPAGTQIGLRRALMLVGILSCLPVLASAGGLSGLNYSLAPGAEWVLWDSDLGLEDNVLYGGRLSLNFGRYIALRGYYFGNSEIETDFSDLDFGDGVDYSAQEPKVDVTSFGADVSFGFGSGSIVPYLYGGPGIMRLTPEGGERSEQIGLKAGAGLKMRLSNRVEGLLYVEDNMFRLNRGLLLAEAPVDDPESDEIRHNLGIGAGISFSLGGYDPSKETDVDRAYRRQFAGGLTGASFKVEPYAGWLDYDNAVELPDQQFAGIRAGIGVGELADVMGYYWRGATGDYRKTEQVQSWGGEVDFNLNPGPGVSPRLLLGAGSLDYMSGFTSVGETPEDKVLFIAGVGLDFNLARRWRAEVRVRDYMFSETDLSETGDPDQILHNWVYSAGFTFGLGGRAADRGALVEGERLTREERVEKFKSRRWGERPRVEEKEIIRKRMAARGRGPGAGEPTLAARAPAADRMVTLPAPVKGEIYVRYGEPGAVTIETKTIGVQAKGAEKAAETAEVAEKPAGQPVAEAPAPAEKAARSAEEDSLRIERQLDRFEARLLDKIDERMARKTAAEPPPPSAPPTARPAEPMGAGERGAFGGMSYQRTLAYTGANVDDPGQFVFGARLEMGPVGNNPSVTFVPEIGFGVFNESSMLIAGHVRWDLGDAIGIEPVNPYVYGGPGLLFFSKKVEDRDRTEGVLNLGYGLSKDFGKWTGFIEHQGIDIYSLHRILLGASLTF
jgi:hypothetical protein